MIFSSWLLGFQRSLRSRARGRGVKPSQMDLPKTSSDRKLATCIEQFESRWLMSASAPPVVFSVNTALDTVDVNPGDGKAEDSSGKISLRAAIQEANASSNGNFEIQLGSQTFTLTRGGTGDDAAATGDLDITNPNVNVTIVGAGPLSTTIDAGKLDRVFDLLTGARLSLSRLTVQGGEVTSNFGGGIRSSGFLNADDVRVIGNSVVGSTSFSGGAVALMNGGSTFNRTLFDSNSSSGSGGAVFASKGNHSFTSAEFTNNSADGRGGAIHNEDKSQLVLSSSKVNQNTSKLDGGGISNTASTNGGQLAIDRTEIAQNTATFSSTSKGGGVFNDGELFIHRSLLAANQSGGDGGGLFNKASATVSTTTLSGNSTTLGGNGGAIFAANGNLSLLSDTITANTAASAGGVGKFAVATVTVQNTIIAANFFSGGSDPDVQGFFISLGNNVIGEGNSMSGPTGFTDGTNQDQVGSDIAPLDPMLEALANNGGPTRTHALMGGSPALDFAAEVPFTPVGVVPVPVTDQRGAPRKVGSAPDIGAFEDSTGASVIFVDTTDDTPDANLFDSIAEDASGKVSLRAAIMQSNFTGGNPTIVLPAGIYRLTQSGTESTPGEFDDLDIYTSLSIWGSGPTATIIDGNFASRAFEILNNVTISGVGIRNGDVTSSNGDGGGILNFGNLSLVDVSISNSKAVSGGGISTSQKFTAERLSLYDNSASSQGGGLHNNSFQLSIISNGSISHNSAADEGGGILNSGILELRQSTISGNSSEVDGGGIANQMELTVFGGSISNNSAKNDAGGIGNEGKLRVFDAQIQFNVAGRDAGGVGTLSAAEIYRTKISNNSAGRDAGGLGVTQDSNGTAVSVQVTASSINNNTATRNGGGVGLLGDNVRVAIDYSSVDNNSANGGGGIEVTSGSLDLQRSSVSDNLATSTGGGGVRVAAGAVNISNATISQNLANGGNGGGVLLAGGKLQLSSGTIVANTSATGGGIATQLGTRLESDNTIIADNLATSGATTTDVAINGFARSLGNNFVGIGAAPFVINGQLDDQVGSVGTPLDPQLGPLQNNGGLTRTHLPQSGSPVIDAGNADMTIATDQRGVPRPENIYPDIGATEFGFTGYFVNTTDDTPDANPGDGVAQDASGKTSLRAAIMESNASVNEQTIILPSGRYQLTRTGANEDAGAVGDLDISESVRIFGYGSGSTTIDGLSADRIIDIQTGASVVLSNLSIEHGQTTGGGVSANGGAIRIIDGNLTLAQSKISNSKASGDGGGIFASSSNPTNEITLNGTHIEGNQAPNGGGVYVTGGRFAMTNGSSVTSNSANALGGGIYLNDTAGVIQNAIIKNNTTEFYGTGGGIVFDGVETTPITSTINNTVITENMAGTAGGIYNTGADVRITASRIDSNTASDLGGGGILNQRLMTIQGSLIEQNQATGSGAGGGGISNLGVNAELTILSSEISSNAANSAGGGGIRSTSKLTINGSTIAENVANSGGGLAADSGITTITSSTFSGNSAASQGGAIFINSATVSLLNVTVAKNSAFNAGGIYDLNSGATNLKNTLVADNTSFAGANDDLSGNFVSNGFNLIGNRGSASGFTNGTNGDIVGGAMLTSITAASNTSPIRITSSGHGLSSGDRVRIFGVDGNFAANGVFAVSVIDANQFDLLDPLTNEPVSGSGSYSSGGSVTKIIDPKLGLLRNNTFPPVVNGAVGNDTLPGSISLPTGPVVTRTHELLTGSPAIDAGTNTGTPSLDQRGFPIPSDGDNNSTATADIGAFELYHATASGVLFNDLDGDGMRQLNEPGLSGQRVYADYNRNGRLDPGEPNTLTVVDNPSTAGIDETGSYFLELIAPGSQVVDVVRSPNTRPTAPLTYEFGPTQGMNTVSSVSSLITKDIDDDGVAEFIYVDTNANTLTILKRNTSGGYFEFASANTGGSPKDLQMGYFNADSLIDFAVANSSDNTISLFFGTAGGLTPSSTFSVGSTPRSIAVGDFNSDGKDDLAVANAGSDSVSILLGNGAGGFSVGTALTTGDEPVKIVAGDFDLDGVLDLATADRSGNELSVFTGKSDGSFTARNVITVAGVSPSSLIDNDFDRDGNVDLIYGSASLGKAYLARNVAAGKFDLVTLGSAGNPDTLVGTEASDSIAASDIDNDGDTDLVVGNSNNTSGEITILINTATGIQSVAVFSHKNTTALALSDLNGDGRADVISASTDSGMLEIQANLIGSSFQTFQTGVLTSGVDLGIQQFGTIRGHYFLDLNNNGFQDITETGTANISLFLDTNGNGRQDPYEPVAATRSDDPATNFTNEAGDYEFRDVLPGNYHVVAYLPGSNLKQTTEVPLTFDSKLVSSGGAGRDTVTLDVNNDGHLDLVALVDNEPNLGLKVLLGDGLGRFVLDEFVAVGPNAISVRAADFDNDGDSDLAVIDYFMGLMLYENNAGKFSLATTITGFANPASLAIGDLNGDQQPDIVVGEGEPLEGGIGVVLNLGNFTFTTPDIDIGDGSTSAVQLGDLDGDSDLDIVALSSNNSRLVNLFANSGNGSFILANTISLPARAQSSVGALALGDVNEDGLLDIAVAISEFGDQAVVVYRNFEAFDFGSALTVYTGDVSSIALVDIDSDQRFVPEFQRQIDLIVGSDSRKVTVLQGLSGTSFQEVQSFTLDGSLRGFSFGDFDEDQRTDIALTRAFLSASEFVLFNRLGSPSVSVVSNDISLVNPIGYVATASVSGTTFDDLNSDGIRQGNEPALANITVYADTNYNNRRDPFEPSTVTALDGSYLLNGLDPRMTVLVRQDLSLSRVPTAPVGFQVYPHGVEFSATSGTLVPSGETLRLTDIDFDSDLDIIQIDPTRTLNSGSVTIYRNDPNTGELDPLTIPLPSAGMSLRTADVNNDAIPDLAVALANGSVALILSTAVGQYSMPQTFGTGFSETSDLEFVDFDHDFDLDILVTSLNSSNVATITNSSGTFAATAPISLGTLTGVDRIVFADLDLDGLADFVVSSSADNKVIMATQQVSGGFSMTSTSVAGSPKFLRVVNFVGGSLPDLLVGSTATNTISAFHNDSGTYQLTDTVTLAQQLSGLSSRFLGLNGSVQVVASHSFASVLSVVDLNISGEFSAVQQTPIGLAADDLALGDINGDFLNDVVTSHLSDGSTRVFLNSTSGIPGAISLTPRAGDSITGLQLGSIFAPGAVSGIVFHDSNGNGTQEVGESPIQGVLVYADLNLNGKFELNEPSYSTDSNGAYFFGNVPSEREVIIRQVLPMNATQTRPSMLDFATHEVLVPSPVAPFAIAAGDINGDGIDDVITSPVGGGTINVYLHSSDGSFSAPTSYSTGSGTSRIVVADLDGDNDLDVITANPSGNSISVLLNDGFGVLTSNSITVTGGPIDVQVRDLNGDTFPDLFTVNNSGESFSVLINNGSGGFGSPNTTALPNGSGPESVVLGNFDSNAGPDAVIQRSDGKLSLYVNDGNGGFSVGTTITISANATHVVAGDFNRDNKLDVAVASAGNPGISIYLGDGQGNLTELNGAIPAGLSANFLLARDFNGDGAVDLLTVDSANNQLQLLTNNGMSSFALEVTQSVGSSPSQLAGLSLDADFEQDFVVAVPGSSNFTVGLNTRLTYEITLMAGGQVTNLNFGNQFPNAAPQITVPSTQTIDEDNSLTFGSGSGNAISISDPDAGTDDLEVTLNVTKGLLTLTTTTGLTFTTGDGTNDGSTTFTGSISAINDALEGLFYVPNANATGTDTLSVSVSDLGHSGSGGVMTDADSVTINLTAINDAPTVSVPGTQSIAEDATLTFNSSGGNGLSVQDVDSGTNAVQLTITAFNGVVTLGSTTNLTFTTGDGSADVTMVLRGSIANINAALEGLVFRPDLNFNGAADLSLVINDLGQSGSGSALQASNSVTINVSSVNDSPTVTVPATQSVAEDSTLTFSSANSNAISIADVDAATNPVEVTLTATNGLASLGTTVGLTFSTGTGSNNSTMTFTGTVTDINSALAGLTYQPNSNFNGAASLSVSVNDQGNSGSGGPLTGSGSVTINVSAINDAPIVSVPGTQSTDEDSTLTFSTANSNLISISDLDAGSNAVQVTLSVTQGKASLSSTTGLTFSVGDGTSDATMIFTGSISNINAALNGLAYAPNANFNGPALLSIDVDDQGNSGSGGSLTDSDTVTINVNAVNDAPTVSVPGTQSVAEDTALTFSTSNSNAISIADIDADPNEVEVTLSVTNGLASLSSTIGLAFTTGTGINDATMTFTGTVSDINFALQGLTFQANANFNGAAALSISVNDQGNSGTGGSLTDSDSVTINVSAVNDAPVVSVPGVQTTNEDSTLTLSSANSNVVSISDVDAGSNAVQVTLTVTNGTASLSTTTGLTFSVGDGTSDATMTFTGSITDINTALNGLIYTPNANFNGAASLSLSVNDQGNTGSGGTLTGSGAVTINVNAVNDAPTVSVPATQSVAEDATLTFNTANNNVISISDLDAGSSAVQVTLTVTNGSASLSTTTGLTFSAGDGTSDATMTFTGTISDINGALQGLTYTPTADFIGSAVLSVSVNDLGNVGAGGQLTGSGSVTINVSGVNDAPVVAVPTTQTVSEDGTLTFSTANNNALSLSDIDAGSNPVEVSVGVLNGTLTLSSTAGITFLFGDGTDDAIMTFTGSISDINAALDGLTYTPTANYSGSETLSLGVIDNGNSGVGGALSGSGQVAINVTAINDAPLVIIARANQTVAEDSPLTFTSTNLNVLSIADPDAGSNIVQLTLAVQQGTATLSQTTGLSFTVGDGISDSTMTLTGTIADINAALFGLVFIPTADFNGAARITLTVDDLGNTGSGGALTASDFTNINVTAVNDAPAINAPSSEVTDEDTALVFSDNQGNPISLTDVDAGQGIVQATIHVTNGLFSLSQTTGLSFSIGDGTDDDRMVFTGKLADINAALQGLTYTPAAEFTGPAELGLIIDDQGNSGSGGPLSDSRLMSITVTAINDAPVFAPANPTFSVDENATIGTVVGSVSVTDVDSAPSDLSFSIISGNTNNGFAIDSNGQLTVANSAALNFNTTPTFTLTVRVTDSSAVAPTPLTVDTTVTVNLNDLSTVQNFVVPMSAFIAANGNVTIKRDGEFIRAVNSDNDLDLVQPMLFSDVLDLDINGRDDLADTLTLDFTGGNPIHSNGSFFGGELDANDSIQLLNGSATDISHKFLSSGSGSLSIDGTKLTLLSVEARTDKLTNANRTAVLGDTGPIVLADGVQNDGTTNLLVGTDALSFNQTTGSFTITRTATTSADLQLLGADSSFTGSLFANLGSGDDSAFVNRAGFNNQAKISINTGAGNDQVLTAASNSDLLIDTGAGFDHLVILDKGFKSEAIKFTGSGVGSATLKFLDDSSGTIDFSNLEEISSLLNGDTQMTGDGSTNVAVSIEFPNATNTVTIADTLDIVVQHVGGTVVRFGLETPQSSGGASGGGGGGQIGGGGIGTVGGVTLQAGSPSVSSLSLIGGTAADTFNLLALPTSYGGKLDIDGGAGNDNFVANLPSQGASPLQAIDISAESVNVGGAIGSLGNINIVGDVTLTAPLQLSSPSTLVTGNFDSAGFPITAGGQVTVTGTSKVSAGSFYQSSATFIGNADITNTNFAGLTTFNTNVDLRGDVSSLQPILFQDSLRVFGTLSVSGGQQQLPLNTTLLNGTINSPDGFTLSTAGATQDVSTLTGNGTLSGGPLTVFAGGRLIPDGKLTLPSTTLSSNSTVQFGIGKLEIIGTFDPAGATLEPVSQIRGGGSSTSIIVVSNDGTEPIGGNRFQPAELTGQLDAQGTSATLTNGEGDGAGSVTVDATGRVNQATIDILGSTGAIDPIFESIVLIQRSEVGGRVALGEVATDVSSMNGSTNGTTATFSIGALQFSVTQTLTPLFNDFGQRSGSLLTQTYSILNTSQTTESFELFRYLDADLGQVGGINDGGRRFVTDHGEEFLFTTDNANPDGNTAFVGISAIGGTHPQTGRFEINAYSGLESRIRAGSALADSIFQDANGDGRIDDGAEYDVTAALRNLFTLAGGASDSYTTHTLLGSGQPETSLQTAAGRFANLPEGAAINLPVFDQQNQQIGTQSYRLTYSGGDGNDIAFTPASSISGFVFNDLNASGTSDISDTAVPNQVVNLRETETNSLIASTTTDANGRYTFSGLPAGSYRVEFFAPDGQLFTQFLTGGSALNDSDANPLTGFSQIQNVAEGASINAVDAGLIPVEIRIDDARPLPEGAAGITTTREFVVSLNGFSSHPVTVDVTAVAGNADSGLTFATLNSDFQALSGTNGGIRITFRPGQTEQTVRVNVIGDNVVESDEAFEVQLSNPINSLVARGTALGIITNDDVAQPTLLLRPETSSTEGNQPERNTLNYTVELLGGAISQDVTVFFETVSQTPGPNTATPNVDFIPVLNGSVIIPAGQTSATIRIGIISDGIFENNETVAVRLTSAINATVGVNASAMGNIVDDDNLTPTISIDNGSILELDDPSLPVLEIPVNLNSPAPEDLTLTYSTLNLTGPGYATSGIDFTGITNGTLVIRRGSSHGVIRIVVTGDQTLEGDETLAVELTGITGQAVLGDVIAIGTIVNDDVDRPTVRLRAGNSEFEGRSGRIRPMSFFVEMNGTSDSDVVVFVSTVDLNQPGFATAGTADNPNADYIPFSNRRVVIPAGSTSAEVRIDVIGDELVESDEMIRLKISSVGSNADLDRSQAEAASFIINDDSARPVATIRPTTATEADAPRTSAANFTVRLDAIPQTAVTATYRTVAAAGVPNAATSDVDYRSVTGGTVTFAPGQQEALISIVINGDEEAEPPEDFFVELTDISSNADLDPFHNIASATIADDDSGDVLVSLRSLGNVTEGDTPQLVPAQFILELSRPSTSDITVTLETLPPPPPREGGNGPATGFATPGDDFVLTSGRTIVIPAGQTSVTFGVSVIGDDLFERDEKMVLGIQQVSAAVSVPPINVTVDPAGRQAETVIVDDDSPRPTLSINDGYSIEGDPDSDFDVVFQVTLSGPLPTGTVVIELETATGSGAGLATQDPNDPHRDFFATRRQLFFDPSVTTQEFRVRIIGDDQFEGPELFFLKLVSATNVDLPVGTLQAVGTIGNDDAPHPTLSIDSVDVLEGDTAGQNQMIFTISLDADPEASGANSSISVEYTTRDITAVAGTDYTPQVGTLTFLPGERTKTITVPVIGNTLDELPKEFLLELFNGSGAELDPAAFQGLGRINNDDSPNVQLRVDSISQREGNTGSTLFDFSVTRVGRSNSNITVDYTTAAGTATAGTDFTSKSGTLTFAPNGPVTQTVTVEVRGDETLESEIESFFLTLNNATNATIDPQFAQGTGSILDDDQRVFREDGDAELIRLATLIQDAITRLGNDPENAELLELITTLSREVLTRVGLSSGLVFVTDPVDFILTDQQGRSTGYTSTSGEVTESPRSYYSGDGRVELVVIPQAAVGLYPLQLSSVGSGEYRSAATLVTDSGTAKTITNSGTLNGEVQLALDFRESTTTTAFPQISNVFGKLADSSTNRALNTRQVTTEELVLATDVAQALATLQADLNDNSLTADGETPASVMLNSLINSLSGMGQAVDGLLPDGVTARLRRLGRSLTANQRANSGTPDNAAGEESNETLLRNLGRALLGAPGVLLDILNSIDLDSSAEPPATPQNDSSSTKAPSKAADVETSQKKTAARAVPAPHSVAMKSSSKNSGKSANDDEPAWRYGRGKTPTPWDTEVSLHRKTWPWSKPEAATVRDSEQATEEPAEQQSEPNSDAG